MRISKKFTMQKYVDFNTGASAARRRACINSRVGYIGIMNQEIRCGHFTCMRFHRNPSSGRVVVYFLYNAVIEEENLIENIYFDVSCIDMILIRFYEVGVSM